MNSIKNYLLNTGYFIDNSYLDSYCLLVKNNQFTKKEPAKTQTHHILPRCYFKLLKLKLDNSYGNLVELSYSDHALAHYYLYQCTFGLLKEKLQYAFLMLVDTKKCELDLENIKEIIQTCKQAVGNHAKSYLNHIYINNGTITKHVAKEDAEIFLKNGWIIGNLNNSNRTGYKCMTNGSTTVFAITDADIAYYESLGYYFGRHYKPALGRKQSKAEKTKKSIAMNGIHKNKIHINNGTVCKFIPQDELDKYLALGWVRGRLMKNMKKFKETN